MRKEAGFEVMDRIRLYAADNEKILTVLKDHMDEIKDEVLADEIVLGSIAGYEKNGVLTVKVYAWVLKRHRNKEDLL